ncbi:dihydroorotase [Methylophilaceae bacterium]|jgi:dihydroorotase|nr:dihydroorotase [Betaproteobacteria bacterium]MCH9841776.1 dihydroorotase [Betaproteobacteria bacterium]MDC0115518.1 dihydroorotase [Methylophilaceae bacterium]MDC0877309.1 dihydroorotase [Methylophilaceae bacterium]MDC1281488.1 dihydroorotase [Methylophilaceae bacterium]
MNEIRILKPDDMHLHVRDGAIMANVIQDTARQFARAIIMPNLSDPIINAFKAEQYYRAIKATSTDLEPLMTLYFTDQLTMIELDKVKHSPHIHGVKLYPAGVTTNSESGIDSINDCFPIFEMMEKKGIPLLLHGEVNDPSVDIFDREKVFIDKYLTNICKEFPSLRIVFEHISTKEAVDFVSNSNQLVSATITPQHILLNRNDLLVGGIKPHNYCLPIVKRSSHQKAVLNAAISGNPKFFLGTDSAPHFRSQKESACGCAGIYSARTALEFYAQIFDENNALDKLENFASKFGADFYGLPQNKGFITLTKKEYKVPSSILIENQELIPFYAGETLKWQLSSN